jgi:hypothetical protein
MKTGTRPATYSDNYPSYGTSTTSKTHLQITSLISILDFDYSFYLQGNTFQYSSSTKALLYLDFNDRKTTGRVAVFDSNTFYRNGAYFDGGAIHLRARGIPGYDVLSNTGISDENYYPCSGYSFTNNIFENTIGCPGYSGGAIKFYCFNDGLTPTTTTNDVYSKTQTLLSSSANIATLTDTKN